MQKKYLYKCKHCEQEFIREINFLSHRCKMMKRAEHLSTAEGHAAWLYYSEWLKINYSSVPSSAAFLKSRYYNSFVNFTAFVKKMKLPDVSLFIRVMKRKKIQPTLWTTDDAYLMYLEYIDYNATSAKQAGITTDTLFDLAKTKNTDISNIFSSVTPNEIIQLLRQRKLSPWILLNSPKFKKFYVENTTTEEKIILETIIRFGFWSEKFKKDTKSVELMKKITSELNL